MLKEMWEAGARSDEMVLSFVLETQERLKAMADMVKENLEKSQEKQKHWYDKGARVQQFEVGDPVLVLLPTTTDKLLAQWQGPYLVVMQEDKVTYQIDMHDRKKRQRVFHANMLKAFQVRKQYEGSYYTEEGVMEED